MTNSGTTKENLIDGEPLENLCRIYKSERAERIIASIIQDVISKSRKPHKRLTRKKAIIDGKDKQNND